MKTFVSVCRPVLVALLLSASTARAEMVDFSYSWTMSPGSIFIGDSDGTLSGASTGSVAFALAPDGSPSVTLDGASVKIPGATVTTSSSGGGTAGPDLFDTSYGLHLHLIDSASGASGDLTFAGTLAGELTASTSSLMATFATPTTQEITLGGLLYSVTIVPTLVALPIPGATPAEINAHVKVSGVPEPSTLVLLGLGLPLLGAVWRKRGRREAVLAPA